MTRKGIWVRSAFDLVFLVLGSVLIVTEGFERMPGSNRIEHEAQVRFLCAGDPRLDAAGAHGHAPVRCAEQCAQMRFEFAAGICGADQAGFAAPAGRDLRLDHPRAGRQSGGVDFGTLEQHPMRHGCAVQREQRFRVVLEKKHQRQYKMRVSRFATHLSRMEHADLINRNEERN